MLEILNRSSLPRVSFGSPWPGGVKRLSSYFVPQRHFIDRPPDAIQHFRQRLEPRRANGSRKLVVDRETREVAGAEIIRVRPAATPKALSRFARRTEIPTS
jgi:hypothetical protein